jgi:hypothetical protein
MKHSVLVCSVLFGGLASGCSAQEEGRSPQQAVAQLTPQEATEARRTIVRWLECEECDGGELEAVVELGPAAIPTLAAVLRQGPSPAARESARLSLEASYAELEAHAAENPRDSVPVGRDEYVTMFLDNYEALYRIRAATALGAIGGPDAEAALRDAPRGARADVSQAVSAALDSLQGS